MTRNLRLALKFFDAFLTLCLFGCCFFDAVPDGTVGTVGIIGTRPHLFTPTLAWDIHILLFICQKSCRFSEK